MTESSNVSATTTTIQLDTMTLEQLDQLQQREENRLPIFTQRLSALRSAAARLTASAAAVTELYPPEGETNDDTKVIFEDSTCTTTTVESPSPKPSTWYKPVFVPLTESVYLPGQICTDTKSATLLVELGTGYFVEQNVPRTVDFLERKRTMVAANADNGT
jgi:Prefoldin subunit